MIKTTTAVMFLLVIGGALLTAGMSCNSCGSECARACGTRRFRSCCFNYLRKKRGPEELKLSTPGDMKSKTENVPKFKIPTVVVESIPETWLNTYALNDFESYPFEEAIVDHIQTINDA